MAGFKVFKDSVWRATGVEDSQWDVLNAVEYGDSVYLSWPVAGGSPVSYEVSIGDNVIDVGDVTSYSVTSGLIMGNKYNFKVRSVYSDGSTGGWSYFKNKGPLGWNAASGGTETTVSNYNGTGETWKVHTFTSSGTFTVASSVEAFRVLIVGGGGSGGNRTAFNITGPGGGGGGGGVIDNLSETLPVGAFSASVGGSGGGSSFNGSVAYAGGGGGNGSGSPQHQGGTGGTSGAPTSFAGYAGTSGGGSYGGGGGGAGGAGGGWANAGAGKNSTITGSSVAYGRGARGGGYSAGESGWNGPGYGGGGGGQSQISSTRISGNAGVVIVAYRIG